MKKIGIICFHNIRYLPYLNTYIDILNKEKDIKYDIIYLNRNKMLVDKIDNNYISINWIGKYGEKVSLINKIINFINFKFRVCSIIKKEKYDYLIILSTMPGILLSNYLKKHYKNKYLIDIRDYTYEKINFYYRREVELMKNASMKTISSPDFKKFLPEGEYLLCHNVNPQSESIMAKKIKFAKSKSKRIIISYIGSISYEEYCLKLMDLVLKDERFEFHFYGNESTSNLISTKVKEFNNSRIKFHGPFVPNDKEKIYLESDVIFNCYGNNRPLVKYAISNKFYDGALYHRPLIVSPNTTMDNIGGVNSYAIDLLSASNLDELYNWYVKIDKEKFNLFCENIIKNSIIDNKNINNELLKNIMECKNDND